MLLGLNIRIGSSHIGGLSLELGVRWVVQGPSVCKMIDVSDLVSTEIVSLQVALDLLKIDEHFRDTVALEVFFRVLRKHFQMEIIEDLLRLDLWLSACLFSLIAECRA